LRWAEGDSAPKLASVRVGGLRIEPAARFFEGTPAQGLIAIVRLEPAGLRLFLEMDLPFAALAVSRVPGPVAGQAAAATASAARAARAPRPEALGPRGGEAIAEIFQRLKDAIGSATVEVRAVAGQSKLSPSELAGLAVGDIIVPDEFAVVATESGLGGKVDLR